MKPLLGAFKRDHLQPVELILFHKFSISLTFILGSPIIYYPRERKMRKRDSPINGWDTGVSVLGAFKLDCLQPVELILFHKFSTFLTFILGSPIIYSPRERKMRKWDSPKSEWDTGVSVLRAFKLDCLRPVELILFYKFSTFFTFIPGSPIIYRADGVDGPQEIERN